MNLLTEELRKDGIRLKLHDQPFQVLAMLVTRPGELVTREEIRQKLWPSGTFVDFENGLNSAVNRLRDALGDSAHQPRFVETVPRHGYRFIAEVSRQVHPIHSVPVEAALDVPSHAPRVPFFGRGKALIWKVLLASCSVAALAGVSADNWHPSHGSPSSRISAELKFKPVPLVTYEGGEQWLPAFSPDGSRLAYSWSTGEGWFLEVKQLGSDTRLRLTKRGANFPPGPAWSPDGRQIAYTRADARDDRGIFITSAVGGPERKLRTLSPWRIPQRMVNWSPDGRWIVFADEAPASSPAPSGQSNARGPNVLYLISPETLETRQLTTPVDSDFGDSAPSFSPDGTTVAYVHTTSESRDVLCTIAAHGGTPRSLSIPGLWTNGLSWTADGKSLVFDRSIAGGFSLWTSDLASGESHQLLISSSRSNLLEPAVWRDRIAYESHETQETIGRIPLTGARLDVPQTPLASTRNDREAHFSYQGDRIAFISDRTGADEAWITDHEGANAFQVTHLASPLKDVAWHPDGKSLAVSTLSGKIFLVDIQSTSYRVLYQGSAFTDEGAVSISFSQDGKFLYVMGEPGFGLQYTLMKVPFSGGEPVKVMEGVVMNFAESVDGKTLFYSRAESASLRDNLAIWSRPVVGGPEQLVLPRARIWAVGSDKLYVLTEKSTIDGYTFSGKRIRTMAKVAHFAWSLPMSVSPDNRAILIAYQRHQSIEIDMIQGLY